MNDSVEKKLLIVSKETEKVKVTLECGRNMAMTYPGTEYCDPNCNNDC